LFCFFFQAEDGIRDRNVTGVQTCALPISEIAVSGAVSSIVVESSSTWEVSVSISTVSVEAVSSLVSVDATIWVSASSAWTVTARSEERRVGKECRYRWTEACHMRVENDSE